IEEVIKHYIKGGNRVFAQSVLYRAHAYAGLRGIDDIKRQLSVRPRNLSHVRLTELIYYQDEDERGPSWECIEEKLGVKRSRRNDRTYYGPPEPAYVRVNGPRGPGTRYQGGGW